MAFEVLDEHEQGELVQKWLRENALSIVVGVGLGLALIFGALQWKAHRAMHTLEASKEYLDLSNALEKKNYEGVKQISSKLREDYADTPYALLAAMQQAQVAVTGSDKEAAYSHMEWVYQHANDSLKDLAATRLARLQIAAGKNQEALDLLAKLNKDSYSSIANELRGDALLGLGRKEDARIAYSDASAGAEAGAPANKLLQMKLANLGGTAEKTVAEKQS